MVYEENAYQYSKKTKNVISISTEIRTFECMKKHYIYKGYKNCISLKILIENQKLT